MTASGAAWLAAHARPLVQALSAAFPDLGGSVTDAPEARKILAAGGRAKRGPEVAEATDLRIPGPEGEVPVRVYRPYESGEAPAPIVYFHGGGFVLGDLDLYDATARALAAGSGRPLISVDYRLAPEHPFPAAAEDAYAAVCWAAQQYGTAPAVAGDSAGGNLAAVCCLLARDRGGPPISRQALIYPQLDPAQDTASYRRNADGCFLTAAHLRWFWRQYLPRAGDAADPYAAPLRTRSHADLPPAHIVTAACDPLCDEGEAYAWALSEAGVPVTHRRYDGMFHGFLGLAGQLPEGAEARAGVCGFLRGRRVGS
ncbi:alpha/beta hydrolase [Streptomyces boninensis]|uniref:alpha/beta hydrolase n=1 Tax=Streptomyces boninensis TaxID=2039455 RepID=UPI003B2252D5